MELYLVRHAIAAKRDADRWPDDSLRPLTEEGAARFRSAARGLTTIVPAVERVLASPYARAWQTAEILREVGWPEPEPRDELGAARPPDDSAAMVAEIDADSLAVVGHEPNLSLLASFLLTGDHGLADFDLKKGSVTLLELPDETDGGAAVLRWSLSPKILRRLDSSRAAA